MNTENSTRVEVLYKRHYKSLLNYANNITKDSEISEELLSQLFEFLLTKIQPKLYYADSFNLAYAQRFIFSKFINYINEKNKLIELNNNLEVFEEEEDYDYIQDNKIEELKQTYLNIVNECKNKNKYGAVYIKKKLYGLSVKNSARQLKCHINSIYSRFREFDIEVNEKFDIKKAEIEKKYEENED